MSGLTTIQISKETREDIKQFGTKDETYDEILHKMMEMLANRMLSEKARQMIETEEFVPFE